MSTKPKPWTAKHKAEAQRRTYEIAATLNPLPAIDLAQAALWGAQCERRYRDNLSNAGFDAPRIEREVRRLRGLAEGRLVRETAWRVRYLAHAGAFGSVTVDLTREEAMSARDRMRSESGWDGVVVRVERVRRASRKVG